VVVTVGLVARAIVAVRAVVGVRALPGARPWRAARHLQHRAAAGAGEPE
jgi:Ni/Fe-hydrogenase subunit HybB-like protein